MREHDGNDIRKLHIPLNGKMRIARVRARVRAPRLPQE
jgi:hypothetical protein